MIPVFCPILPAKATALIDIIRDLGLAANLQVCLDAGDSASYDGTSQVWADRSGNGYNFNRGTTTSSETSDPTFNGNAGCESANEYFSLDGGDYFTLAQANPTWVNDIPKDSAKFGIGSWIYFPNSANIQDVGGTLTASARSGFNLGVNANRTLGYRSQNATADTLLIVTTATVPTSTWAFLGVSIDEGAGTGFLQINGTQESKTTTYASPDTTNSDNILKLMNAGDGQAIPGNGARCASLCIWGGTAPSQTAMAALFTTTRDRFGI